MSDHLAQLCRHVGVAASFRGFDGETITVSPDTQIAVLRAMGIDLPQRSEAQAVLQDREAKDAQRPAPQDVIVTADAAGQVALSQPAEWVLYDEGCRAERARGHATTKINLPPLPLGIHRLELSTRGQTWTTWVLSRPKRAYALSDAAKTPRIWGVLAALYGLTDGRTKQIGTYALLGDYAAQCARHGADLIGINPVHAMGNTRPGDIISPYSPSHRAFLNTWHCASGGPAPSDLIDYNAALAGSHNIMAAEFAAFDALPETHPDKAALATFCAAQGAPLQDYAAFEALADRFGPDWRDWPQAYHTPDTKAVGEYVQTHKHDIAHLIWAQWRADRVLQTAQKKAVDAGMRIGLYLDLAVGPRLGGAETWGAQTSLVSGATLGAPPDPLGPEGQSWGLAPQSPFKLRQNGYASFARLLRSTMRHAGMIRIDHALGLMRSFWIPEGSQEGTYVQYPLDALLAVVAIESVRTRTVVVGEDLGLVPTGLRDALVGSGIYGLDVLQYMRSSDGGFAAPEKTRKKAICSFATHDTPTITGFFAAEDAQMRARLGGLSPDALAREREDRAAAAATLATPDDPVHDIHQTLARSRSEIVAVQLDDMAGRKAQQNLPGTVDEYPNWRLRAPFSVQDIATSDAFTELGRTMARYDRSNPKRLEKDNDLQNCSHIAD